MKTMSMKDADKNINESPDIKRKRLIFRSWHRGTREMDLLLGTFADKHLPGYDEQQLKQYEEIMSYSDPDLYNWMSGREEPPANVVSGVFDALAAHKYSMPS